MYMISNNLVSFGLFILLIAQSVNAKQNNWNEIEVIAGNEDGDKVGPVSFYTQNNILMNQSHYDAILII